MKAFLAVPSAPGVARVRVCLSLSSKDEPLTSLCPEKVEDVVNQARIAFSLVMRRDAAPSERFALALPGDARMPATKLARMMTSVAVSNDSGRLDFEVILQASSLLIAPGYTCYRDGSGSPRCRAPSSGGGGGGGGGGTTTHRITTTPRSTPTSSPPSPPNTPDTTTTPASEYFAQF